jgi:hypothetical protein
MTAELDPPRQGRPSFGKLLVAAVYGSAIGMVFAAALWIASGESRWFYAVPICTLIGALVRRERQLLAVFLGAMPIAVLIGMNTLTWHNPTLNTLVFSYGAAILIGLLMALTSLYLSIQRFRAAGFSIAPAVAVIFVAGFVTWVSYAVISTIL